MQTLERLDVAAKVPHILVGWPNVVGSLVQESEYGFHVYVIFDEFDPTCSIDALDQLQDQLRCELSSQDLYVHRRLRSEQLRINVKSRGHI